MDAIVEKQCFDYMKSVNSIAQKIAEDIDVIKETHKDWESFDLKKRDKILNDKLIDPYLIHRYENKNHLKSNLEFSSNFSWFTRSQVNLFTYVNLRKDKIETPLKKVDILSPLKKTSTQKAPFDLYKQSDNVTVFSKIKNKMMKEDKQVEKTFQKGLFKPKNPPPPPPSKIVSSEEKNLLEEQHIDDIPKTGFDFLDNW